jgi:hypothetical protein
VHPTGVEFGVGVCDVFVVAKESGVYYVTDLEVWEACGNIDMAQGTRLKASGKTKEKRA